MSRIIKHYEVEITTVPGPSYKHIWYAKMKGKSFVTTLAVVENNAGQVVPVFKCVEAPFYHIYPIHCTVIEENTITLKT